MAWDATADTRGRGGCAQGCINNAAMSDVSLCECVCECDGHIFTHTAAHEMTDEPKDRETDEEEERKLDS